MHAPGKSDEVVVPENPPNKEEGPPNSAEGGEGRTSAKGNSDQQTRLWAQTQVYDLQIALERIQQVASSSKEEQFHALWHHVYHPDRLRQAFFRLKRDSAPGIDGETWQQYAEDLEPRLLDLSERLKRGAYKARAVRRVQIPKADGRKRLLGVPALEDKIVQQATVEVLNAVYESDFLRLSYGFRPKRGQHDALDALSVGLVERKVNWVLDADIRGFFDALDHEWLVKFVEHRIRDRRVLRHIKKWLKAGVLEDGEWKATEVGSPQGGCISPLLANIYLHYVFDLWVANWRKRARGDVVVVRYADDFVVGFQHKDEAQRFWRELEERLKRFNLELHPDKTQLIEFGRFAAENRQKRGAGKPGTFSFLGFTHYCGKSRSGKFVVKRRTSKTKKRAKLKDLKGKLRSRLHWRAAEVGAWLGSVLEGHYQYYGVPGNYEQLSAMRDGVLKLWRAALLRRSQRHRLTWERMGKLAKRWLPKPRIYHPPPWKRLHV